MKRLAQDLISYTIIGSVVAFVLYAVVANQMIIIR